MLNYGLINRLPHTSLYIDLPQHILQLLDSTVLHSLHHITAAQQRHYDEGQLHFTTKKVAAHFSPRSLVQVKALNTALCTVKNNLSSVPLFPRILLQPVPFTCPQ
eukprot:4562325-Karenia_brevis.AAC.1